MLGKPPNPLRYAPLMSEDAMNCAALHSASFAKGWPVADFEHLLASAPVVADGAKTGDRFVGFVLSRCAADEAEILTISVDATFRRRGVAKALLAFHMARLAQVGVANLFLEVEEANEPALALYGRYGFVKVGERSGYYALPDGRRALALVLACRI